MKEIKTAPDKLKLRKFITRRSSLQEISKGIFQTIVKGVTRVTRIQMRRKKAGVEVIT